MSKFNRWAARHMAYTKTGRVLRRMANWWRKPVPYIIIPDFGGQYPACPRCENPVYESHCWYCGQRLKGTKE